MASNGLFLSFLTFLAYLGTKNESYYWDNEPFNDLCVDLSGGAGEAHLKIGSQNHPVRESGRQGPGSPAGGGCCVNHDDPGLSGLTSP